VTRSKRAWPRDKSLRPPIIAMMARTHASSHALELMLAFAERTGLTSARPSERYLWTDAFAVCNFIALDRLDLAERLAEHVHLVLGRHRTDDERSGWLSGLPEAEGERHPTRGGLRIGKRLAERRPGDALDERLEWERDGQYFHYLTKWMHALDQLTRRTRQVTYNIWARELADVARRAFTWFDPVDRGGRRMYWKMSTDLSRPLVLSMGQHDPLDGYVTCLQLQATAERLGIVAEGPSLVEAAADFRAMLAADLTTDDPLGIGGLLTDGARLEQLEREGTQVEEGLTDRLLESAEVGLVSHVRRAELELPAEYRLPFRELGLALGLASLELIGDRRGRLSGLRRPEGEIVDFWLHEANRRVASWREHRDINEVMLATALVPDGFLVLAFDRARAGRG